MFVKAMIKQAIQGFPTSAPEMVKRAHQAKRTTKHSHGLVD